MSSLSQTMSPSPMRKPGPEHHQYCAQQAFSVRALTSTSNESEAGSKTVPWFPDPMEGFDEDSESFAPRHEASTIELFFDLWFVANLATFTQYHAITNRYTFWSYVAFFIVLWTSWFHVVCFDARFTSDSVWERASKLVHFCAFAAFALAGYKFAPVARDVQNATPAWIYRVLCFALLLSRAWLALQYLVTAIMCSSRTHRHLRLTLPLLLNALLFLSVAGVMAGLFGGFRLVKAQLSHLLIGVYVVLVIEFFGSLTISMTWRRLSFKATHIGERLGLLGLIIIGEGVIGTSKTVTRTMGKQGPTYGSSAQIFCIILILLFMWILYFDRVPKYRFGTVKQQLWMALHLPYHLAILGVVEGSQQLAQARYIYYGAQNLFYNALHACNGKHLDGAALASNLTKNIEYFKLNESARGTIALGFVYEQIDFLGNDTGVCSEMMLANKTHVSADLHNLPHDFVYFLGRTIGAMFQAFDIDVPLEGKLTDGKVWSINIALESWVVVYIYFWSAVILLLVCYTITRLLSDDEHGRGTWRLVKHYATLSILSRALMIVFAIIMLVIGALNHMFIQYYLASALILPSVVLMLLKICWSDRISTMWKARKAQKARKYESVAASDVPVDEERTTHDNNTPMQGIRRRGTNAYGYPA